jgi:hypothetical protein
MMVTPDDIVLFALLWPGMLPKFWRRVCVVLLPVFVVSWIAGLLLSAAVAMFILVVYFIIEMWADDEH